MYVSDFIDTEHQFALVTTSRWGQYGEIYNIATGVPGNMLVDVSNFTAILGSLQANGLSNEYTYDISYLACGPDDPIGINWREDAHPYIILMTDEPGQTQDGVTTSDVAIRSNDCQVGSCSGADSYEFFVITKPMYNYLWTPITQYDSSRIKNILVNDVASYVDMLKDMFTDICR